MSLNPNFKFPGGNLANLGSGVFISGLIRNGREYGHTASLFSHGSGGAFQRRDLCLVQCLPSPVEPVEEGANPQKG